MVPNTTQGFKGYTYGDPKQHWGRIGMREGGARQAVWLLTLAPHDGGVAECLNNAQNIVSAGRRGQELGRSHRDKLVAVHACLPSVHLARS